MKQIIGLALALTMLTAALTGCGCMDRTVSEHPGGMITDPTTMPTILPMPTETHRPEETTMPRATDGTESTDSTDGGGDHAGPTDASAETRSNRMR